MRRFTKDDIAFILENFPEKFTWHDPSDPFIVSYGGVFKGEIGMSEFFHQLGTNTICIYLKSTSLLPKMIKL
ncbi:MAG TPA: hypothetical protein VK787_16610 [Puia sp.]|jgi:hypothetical protein|nr:hypothetical protein [Puia sp.]